LSRKGDLRVKNFMSQEPVRYRLPVLLLEYALIQPDHPSRERGDKI
jgi:hypothetical protein